MGEAEDGFTPLSQLNPSSYYRHRVRVRISRMWVSFNPNNGTVFGLNSLLIDSEGGTMRAHVKPKDIKRFEERLAEGKVYALSNFVVWPNEGKYMTCRNPFTTHIEARMVVDEIDGDVDVIPLHYFDFVDFVDVPSRDRNISLLTVEVCTIRQVPKKLQMKEFCSLRIEDFSGNELDVTLFGKLGYDFYAEIRKKCRQDPVVAVFAGMRVCHYKGKGYIVCSLSASKYYLDLEIPEGQQFRANWHHPKIPIVHVQSQPESPVDPTQESQSISKQAGELESSWRTIKQLESLGPFELSENTRFLCRATLKEIDCTKNWCYRGCFHCRQSISRDGSEFWCSQCDPVNKKRKRPVLWYKLNAVVEDDTGTMNLMIFAEEAQQLIGVTPEELFKEINDDGGCTVPAAFTYLPGSTHTFQVAMDDWSSSFVVKWILNNDELTLLQHGGSVQLTVGSDNPLPKQDGYFSVCSCNSQLMEENMVVIKQETELKTEDETDAE